MYGCVVLKFTCPKCLRVARALFVPQLWCARCTPTGCNNEATYLEEDVVLNNALCDAVARGVAT